MRRLLPSLALFLFGFAGLASAAYAHTSARSFTPPSRTDILDNTTRHDASDLEMVVTNFGSLGFDLVAGNAGTWFPVGSQTTPLFASGLWVGGTVAGQTRVTVAEYSMEWLPGRIVGGTYEPDSPDLRCYKVFTIHAPSVPDTTGWGDYVARAAPQGAPVGTRRFDDTSTPAPGDSVDVPGPDLPGHAAVWSVFNDADPSQHTNNAGNTTPLGLEIRQTAFSTLGGPAIYVRWQIRNGGPAIVQDAYVGFWSDPDLGGISDDLVGYDSAHQMGYVYNATNSDNQYGSAPPALGTMLVEGPFDPSAGLRRPAYAFTRYINGTDPNSPLQSFNYMRGLNPDGTPIIDPTTANATRFMMTGNPLFGTGWLDTNPADRRMMLSAGPFTLAPGQSTDLVVAFVIAQGTDRLNSIDALRCKATFALDQYASGFANKPEPDCQQPTVTRCPQPSAYFAGICDAPDQFPPGTKTSLASCAGQRSILIPPDDSLSWCATLHGSATPQERAYREYLGLISNWCAQYNDMPLFGPGGIPVGIGDDAPASCPPVTATTVGELLDPSPPGSPTIDADYIDAVNPAEPRGLEPVDFGLPAFGGGASTAFDFFGSSLDPSSQPDSFPRVEVTFDASKGQLAYRYLRLQTIDGSAPNGNREYRYGGFHFVPLTARDVETGEQLEVAFVERAITDELGTILSPFEQPATFDSTWAPSDEGDGGREYLAVYRRGYSGTPRPEFTVDGAFFDPGNPLPGLYVLTARTEAGRVIDDGDGFFWELHSSDAPPNLLSYLLTLGGMPQNDPDVLAAYDALANNLAFINQGRSLGTACDLTVPTMPALVDISADEGTVTVVWHAEGGAGTFGLERRRDEEAWHPLTLVSPDGSGRIAYIDADVVPGDRLSYRLVDPNSGTPLPGSFATFVVPGANVSTGSLELAAVLPDGDGVRVRFTLPRATSARLDVYDALGRRLGGDDLGQLDAGMYVRSVGQGALHTSGLYFVRLRVDGQERVTKALFVSP